jgi:hypothetical protein
LKEYVFKGKDAELKGVFDWVSEILDGLDRPVPPSKLKAISFVFDILSSEVDHDRLDYVNRDFAHVVQNRIYRVGDIIANAKVAWADRSNGEARLMFDRSAGAAIRDILFWRHKLYAHVYEAPEKAPYDEMILHAVIYLLDEYDSFGHPLARRHERTASSLGLAFVRLSDHDLHRAINESAVGKRSFFSRLLIRDVMTNAPFVFAARCEISNKNLRSLHARHQHLAPRCRSLVQEMLRDKRVVGLEPDEQVRGAAFRKMFILLDEEVNIDGVAYEPVPEEGMFWLLQSFGWHGYYRFQLEKLIWAELKIRWEGFDRWASATAGLLWSELKDAAAEKQVLSDSGSLWGLLGDTPLVFLAMSRLGAGDLSGLLLMDRSEERSILLYDGSGDAPVAFDPGKPEDSANNYWIGAVRPQSMPEEVDQIIDGILRAVFFERGWIDHYIRILGQEE